MPSKKALRTRQRILDAARALVMRDGVASLSIDKVALESGTSKGAFLYHFRNKKALFRAMVEEYVAHLDSRLDENLDLFKDEAEPLIPGYAMWYEGFEKDDRGVGPYEISLLALQLHDPEALEPFRDWYRRIFARVKESPIATPRALAAIMAFEGFFFAHRMGIDDISDELKRATWKFILEEVAPQPKGRKED